MVLSCCVPQCKSHFKRDPQKPLNFHKFPKDEQLKLLWLQKLNINKSVSNSKRVCSDHFNEIDYVTTQSK